MRIIKKQRGIAAWIVALLVTVAVLAVIGAVIAVSSGSGDGGGENRTCHTYCLGLVQLECGSNKAVGACFGAWDCSPPDKGAHPCKDSGGI